MQLQNDDWILRVQVITPSVGRWLISGLFLEPKASVVIIAEDATRIDSKTTTLGLSSTSSSDTDLMKSSSTTSTRSSTRRRMKSIPREVILFRNGAFISKEPISKQQPTTTLCFETTTTTTNNNCSQGPPPLHQQQITATGLQAAAQIVACNVLRQATLNGKFSTEQTSVSLIYLSFKMPWSNIWSNVNQTIRMMIFQSTVIRLHPRHRPVRWPRPWTSMKIVVRQRWRFSVAIRPHR